MAWTDHFDDFGFDVHEIRGAGDAVVVLLRMRGRAKASGMPIAQEIGGVWSKFESGRAGEVRFLPSWEETLAAAGLAERPAAG